MMMVQVVGSSEDENDEWYEHYGEERDMMMLRWMRLLVMATVERMMTVILKMLK